MRKNATHDGHPKQAAKSPLAGASFLLSNTVCYGTRTYKKKSNKVRRT